MKRYFFILVVLSLLIYGCGEEPKHIKYNYADINETLYLSVVPKDSNLIFYNGEKNIDEFKLSFDTNKLTLLGIDPQQSTIHTSNFGYDDKDVTNCMQSIAIDGECIIQIRKTDKAKIGESGVIMLKFHYNEDGDADAESIKYHQLVVTYTSKPAKPQ